MELDLDDLLNEALKLQAKRNADREIQRRAKRSGYLQDQATQASDDYACRLAERAIFRRLLADSSLDAARFAWWFTSSFGSDGRTLDEWRKIIDHQITKEKRTRG